MGYRIWAIGERTGLRTKTAATSEQLEVFIEFISDICIAGDSGGGVCGGDSACFLPQRESCLCGRIGDYPGWAGVFRGISESETAK